ncbi:MAG: 30S ribosomal protein S18 [Actinomycetota bacterium]|nr:30S ribosomal protein S18 [Actinomycetota bacterium]
MARDRKGSRRPSPKKTTIRRGKKKHCQFCADKTTYIDYKDVSLLRKFVSERGKIRARRVTGACSQHQRLVATAVKNAREMALLPFSTREAGRRG